MIRAAAGAGVLAVGERLGDALAAFEAVRPAIETEQDADRRRLLLEGLFGPRGPALYDRATAFREGIDHSWDLRYELD